ncbi:MAG: Peptide methionine sulfoxide reductase MsrA (EC [uncultured Sulfurovum sp.]|uniref:Peptide methionine sulfoxide reductase MsrA n=1 Tax=uncultured Sulfurovum sp. TaxID=269237 RepID=A0A6S6RRW5_9BACT|nr:MAG: Peptide methionine sulfoxide reductase MsrA (EC [uncultured Sulfurovum sp.]
MAKQEIILGGGCFWCLEASFQILKGVQEVVSGYANGSLPNPTYKDICTGTSGHAEVVKVVFDDDIIQYEDILDVFFTIHDPTTLNRQGNDIGTQYRSTLLFQNQDEEELYYEIIDEKQESYANEIVTVVEELDYFYVAENYHQDYLRKNPTQGYCRMVVAPKVTKVHQQFSEMINDTF